MLVEFSFGNFRSFKEIQTLQLEAANIVSKNKEMDENNVMTQKGLDLLKFKAIYGANGSGKSNVIKAMAAFFNIVKLSVTNDPMLDVFIRPFSLDEKSFNQPSFFQIIFIHKGLQYRYGFEADREKIHSEWLFVKDKKEVTYFLRTEQEIEYYNKEKFQETKVILSQNNNLFRPNSLVLSVLSALNGKISTIIFAYITTPVILSGTEDFTSIDFFKKMNNIEFKSRVLDLLKNIDTSIQDIEKVQYGLSFQPSNIKDTTSNNEKLLFNDYVVKRKIKNSNRYFAAHMGTEEAEGTKKLFYLSPALFYALDNGFIMILDEFDARLHPVLSKKIVDLFNSQKTNPKGAQLIVVTHDTNLLDNELLRRDQIIFAEKNKQGESQLIDLVEFKGIKNTASYESDYLKGKFGALPYLNQLDLIFQQ